MKKLALVAAFAAGGLLGLQGQNFAHGGQYRGPGDTVPPGGGGGGGGGAGGPTGPAGPTTPGPTGPSTPGPLAPGTPGATSTANRPVTQGGGDTGPDLTVWSFWWEFNKEPYLNLKAKIHGGATETGSDGFFLGRGEKSTAKDSLRPTEEQIRQKVVPALLTALEKEGNNDIVTGCLIALAKIGDANTESGRSEFEQVITAYLADSNQEISETAAVSLGILANPASIGTLEHLLKDTAEGRKLVGSSEVDYRTRAFAAYGLGLIGAPSTAASEEDRMRINRILAETIETDDTKSRDLRVSCVISIGLVPLGTIDAPPVAEDEEGAMPLPWESRVGQMTYLMAYLQDDANNYLVRAHCPTALARLLQGMPSEQAETWRAQVTEDLLGRMGKHSKDQVEIVQSCVLAMGLIGTNGKEDSEIREALASVPKDVSDIQARNFSMIAMAKVGGKVGAEDPDKGIEQAGKFLIDNLTKGKSTIKPWAGLSIGVMARQLADKEYTTPYVSTMRTALRSALDEEKDQAKIGAYALAAGVSGDVDSTALLLEKLERTKDDEARGYVAVALGLMEARESIEPIQTIVRESKYRPELLKQAAVALGLLGDKELVPDLTVMLAEAKGLATQAAISSALGFIGDQRSIDPLVEMLNSKDITERARGFAAVALGIVADKEPLPWNTKIALDLNYRASTQTLVDAQAGTGILDIL